MARWWSESTVGNRSSLTSSAVTGGTTLVGLVPVRYVRINFFPRRDWVRVVRKWGEDVRGILSSVDDESVELGGATNEDAECKRVDANDESCNTMANSKRVECNGPVVKDEKFKWCAGRGGDESDEYYATMGKDKFEEGIVLMDWGHIAKGWLVTSSPFKRLWLVELGNTDSTIVMSYCAGSVLFPQNPVKPPASGYEYSIVLHGRILYCNLAFHLCSWAFTSFCVI